MNEGKELKNEYMREYMKEYRKKNKEKLKKWNHDFWERKAARIKKEREEVKVNNVAKE